MPPIIHIDHDPMVKLTAWAIATKGREFSGLGLIEREGEILHVVDVDLLGVGSSTFTEFSPERSRQLPPDPRRKLWLHKHPVGDGNPGPHNWSGTDERTATQEPLGGIPQLVQWSVAIVLTPGGWVGRVDIHIPTLQTFHCPVEPRLPTPEIIAEAETLVTGELMAFVDQLLAEYRAMHPVHNTTFYSRYEGDDMRDQVFFNDEDTGFYCTECQAELEFADADDYGYVEYYACPNCNQVYVRTLGYPIVDETYNPKRQDRAWRQSFMKFWRGRH
jgi:hypothetical protein